MAKFKYYRISGCVEEDIEEYVRAPNKHTALEMAEDQNCGHILDADVEEITEEEWVKNA